MEAVTTRRGGGTRITTARIWQPRQRGRAGAALLRAFSMAGAGGDVISSVAAGAGRLDGEGLEDEGGRHG
jgi:hypothetical protein